MHPEEKRQKYEELNSLSTSWLSLWMIDLSLSIGITADICWACCLFYMFNHVFFFLGSTSSIPEEELESLKKKLKEVEERLQTELTEKKQYQDQLTALKCHPPVSMIFFFISRTSQMSACLPCVAGLHLQWHNRNIVFHNIYLIFFRIIWLGKLDELCTVLHLSVF